MSSPPPPYLLVFFFFLLHLVLWANSATEIDYHCSYSDIFFPNSIYESNLNNLLDFLVSTTIGPPYYGDVTYAVGIPPNRVHGEATCGYSSATCYNCLFGTRRDLQHVCYYKKSADALYYYSDYCSLRYEPYNVHTPPPPLFVDSPPPPYVDSPPPPPLSYVPPSSVDSPPPPLRMPSTPPSVDYPPPSSAPPPSVESPPSHPPVDPPPPSSAAPPSTTTPTKRTTISTPGGGATKLALYVAIPVGAGLIVLSLLLFLLWRSRRGPPVNGHGQQEVNVLPPASQ